MQLQEQIQIGMGEEGLELMEIGAYVACMAMHVTYVHPPTLTKFLNLDHA